MTSRRSGELKLPGVLEDLRRLFRSCIQRFLRCLVAENGGLKLRIDHVGDFDPFGDFDLIFGASKLNLKSIDMPIRYAARSYGETQISRFRHGVMLLKMVVFAFFKIKAI